MLKITGESYRFKSATENPQEKMKMERRSKGERRKREQTKKIDKFVDKDQRSKVEEEKMEEHEIKRERWREKERWNPKDEKCKVNGEKDEQTMTWNKINEIIDAIINCYNPLITFKLQRLDVNPQGRFIII